jgi:hypothetical protein
MAADDDKKPSAAEKGKGKAVASDADKDKSTKADADDKKAQTTGGMLMYAHVVDRPHADATLQRSSARKTSSSRASLICLSSGY